MRIYYCRVCGARLPNKPSLRIENMPKSAQYLPDANSIKDDRGVDIEVCQCSGCGLVQLTNEPVPYFREVIRASGISKEMIEFRIKQFTHFIERFSLKGKKVIEIGCGQGEYLSIIKQCGVNAYGLEYLSESVEKCCKKGLLVSKGFIEDQEERLNHAPFDAFFILNFLEHLPDPNSLLRGISNNILDGTVGLVEVPNFDMIHRNKLFSEFISDHLFYFTKETLSTTLQINGFEVLECKEVWYDYIISAIVRKRQSIDMSDFNKYQGKIKKDIQQYIARFPHKEVAIWGAGHQALAVISLTSLSDKIKYVVDSAPFKQEKYTPATHIPIVSPEELKRNPVKAVIIMAASYSDEIAKIVREKFNRNICVAILRDFGLEIV